MVKSRRIGLISQNDPADRKKSSGTIFTMSKSLKNQGYDVVWIPVKINFLYILLEKIVKAVSKLFGLSIMFKHTPIGAYLLSRSIDEKQIKECDVLFAPFSSPALYALKKQGKKLVYLSDATFQAMDGYYFSKMSSVAKKCGNKVEQKAMDVADEIVLSSDWALQSAIKDYKQPLSKVHVIEFGANIDDEDIIDHTFDYEGTLEVLFLGVDWERKGGDIAVEACSWLNSNGVPTVLNIVGIQNLSKDIEQLPYVSNYGFLNKNDKKQYDTLVSVIKKSHCLLLPSLAECSAIAFCEASANGLPIFSHVTGGVPNYVYDGRNGYLLSLGSKGEDFGRKIKECLESSELKQMSQECQLFYKEKLNWGKWAERIEALFR